MVSGVWGCRPQCKLSTGKAHGLLRGGLLRHSITRRSPHQPVYNAFSAILRIFPMRLVSGKHPVVYEEGQQLRDYVYVGDAAKANILVLEDDRADYQVFNVGGGKATSALEYAHLLAENLDKDIDPLIPGEFRFGDTCHIVLDISKLQALGWEPVTPLEQIVQEYIAWVEGQPNLQDYYEAAERLMKAKGTIWKANGGR